MSLLARPAVQRVQAALLAQGSGAQVVELVATARTAADAARALDVPVGAIVKSLVFLLDDDPVMALIAGDRRCATGALPQALGRTGRVTRADAERVRAATGFTIGGVAPLGHPGAVPTVIDASLGRFERVYAAAGHPHCVFATSLDELRRVTGGALSDGVATD